MTEKKTLYVGIDVSLASNTIAAIDDNGIAVVKPFNIPNNQSGAEELEARIEDICRNGNFSQVRIATEATSVYDFHLADYLTESIRLVPFQAEVYRFNPKLTRNFKKALKDLEKTDPVDAIVIAKRLKFGELPHPYGSFRPYLPLQRLSRYRFHLINAIIQEKTFILPHIFLKYSSFSTNKPVTQLLGATGRALINEFFSSEEIAQASLEELTEFAVAHSRNRFRKPEAVAALIQQMAKDSYRIKPGLAKTLNLILASAFRSIRAYQESLKEVDQALADELRGLASPLTSVPGIGPVFSAGILAEVGDVARFPSADALAKYAGLWWPRHQSGGFEGSERRLSKTGNAYLRFYLVEAANSLKLHNEEYRAFYQKKYREVRKNQHKRALVLTARKFVRLVFSLLKTGQSYRREK